MINSNPMPKAPTADNIAFIGYGGVAQGLTKILQDKASPLLSKHKKAFHVVAIADMMKGSIYHPKGLDLNKVQECLEQDGNFSNYPEDEFLVRGMTNQEVIADDLTTLVVEATYTNVKTGQPAIDHIEQALRAGKDVVTTNKGPVALDYERLQHLAEANNASFGFEGTVMSGTPAIGLPKHTLKGVDIPKITGILNGTTNYMITRMEEGLSFDEALKEAQELGFAEADPTSDVEGYDILYKVVILANVVMGKKLSTKDVKLEGLTTITAEDVQQALKENKRMKMIATISTLNDGTIEASVAPVKLPATHPLASISGATNGITYSAEYMGDVTLTGAGAGIYETGYSLLIDILNR